MKIWSRYSLRSFGFVASCGSDILLGMKVALLTLICLVSSLLVFGQQNEEEKRLIAENEKKLAEIILPKVEFQEVRLGDAIAFLRDQSRKLDKSTDDENLKGLNFLLIPGENPEVSEILITLKLKNVPLGEALRYTTSLANLKFKVEPHVVVIRPS